MDPAFIVVGGELDEDPPLAEVNSCVLAALARVSLDARARIQSRHAMTRGSVACLDSTERIRRMRVASIFQALEPTVPW